MASLDLPKAAASAGGRFKQGYTLMGYRYLQVLALMLGNGLSNVFRAQVIARIPIASGGVLHGIDWATQNALIAPILSLIPGWFGQTMATAVAFNSTTSAGRAIFPDTERGQIGKSLFGIDEFPWAETLARAAKEEAAAGADALGRLQNPQERFGSGVGALQDPRRRVIGARAS